MSEVALDRIGRLSSAKQRLLQQKLKERAAAQGPPPLLPSPLRGVTNRFPCSFAQQRLWFLYQLEPASAAYNAVSPLRLRGPLDRDALERALRELVQRHEILRTTFELDDEPVQVVAPSAPVNLRVIDLTAVANAAELPRLIREESALPFNLSRQAPLRVTLIVLGEEDHAVLLTQHHIGTDAWSMGILVREFAALYTAFSQELPPSLPDPEIQYADFAHWQRQWLVGPRLESELAYWREQLKGLPPALELPLDRPRSADRASRAAKCSVRVSTDVLQSLQALGQNQGATLFMTLLAAFELVLLRYTGREDIAIATPIAGRNRLQLESLIGCFINTLVLRTSPREDLDFLALLRQVQEVTLGAYAHQELPLEKLISELQPDRDPARSPIYQIMFGLHNAPAGSLALAGLTLERLPVAGGSAKLDLILNATERSEGLMLLAEYDADLFDATTLQRFLRHFATVLAGAAADPAARVAALGMLAAAERHALTVEWNDTPSGAAWQPVPWLFRRQAERDPGALAVVCGDERLTFGQLWMRSDRLARHLRSRGVGPDHRVGLCVERVPHLLVGILGILQAGAAYVPLEPRLPADRLAFILDDALGGLPATLLLTQRSLAGRFTAAGFAALEVLCLDADWEETGAETAAAEDRPPEILPEALAYVLYTSGSTGRPKGVAVHHRGLASYLSWCLESYEVAAGAGAPVHSSIGFDLTVTSLLAPLLAGRPVVLLPEEDVVPALAEALRQQAGYSLVKLTPAHLRALSQLLSPSEAAGGARTFVVGGEALLAEDLEFWRRSAPATAIVNEYGPTETVVGCVVQRVTADTPHHGPVPIGRPIAKTRVALLDRRLQPVPLGAIGELYIGGEGVARGYLGRPDLTAERFLPDPLTAENDDGLARRMYRSGDLARWLADGRLEFLGRADDQLKLRGYRIEPGEIEAALGQQSGLREAAVVLRTEGGAAQLVACVVPEPGVPPTPDELQGFLAERLPDYMVPAAFIFLDGALPLTANGKVDRKALSRLTPAAQPRSAVGTGDTEPRNPVEELLAAIWREVLGLPEVGIHDNFFELGGDSILSLQVTARMRKVGWRISSRQIFAGPTIAELAALAQPVQPVEIATAAPAGSPVPLTPIQLWFFAQSLPHPEHFNQALLLELRPLASGERIRIGLLRRAVEHLLAAHDSLRSWFAPPAPERPEWQQLVEVGPLPVAALQVDLSALPAERWRSELAAVAVRLQASLDLSRAPLLRLALFTLGDGGDRLLLVAHHLIVDGVSWRILLEDLETACRQLARGERVELPPATSSFQRWAEQLVEHARSAAVQAQVADWLAILRGSVPPLPVDRDEGPNDVASGRVVTVGLDAEVTRVLLQDVPRAYRTQISEVLLTALVEAFAGWTGSRRLRFDLEGHGREEIAEGLDTSRTVGWLTAVYPVLLDLDGATSPGQALRTVKERLRTVPDRGIGYGLLRYLGSDEIAAALRTLPAPEVVFNYFGQLDQIVADERLFRGAAESAGPPRSPAQARPYLLEISASVAGGRLRTSWIYSANRHLSATVESLAAGFLAALQRIADHAGTSEGGYTPSDFPLARLDQVTLDQISATVPGAIEDLYPASPIQQGMLFHTLQAPESGVYVEQLGLVIDEALDVAAFSAAWQQLVDRHAILRTSFVWRGAEAPLQVVHARVSLDWDRQDWRDLSPAEQNARWQAFLEADRRRSFDVSVAPLLRLALIRAGERSYRFLWSHHHVLLDGWSNSILLRELFQLYQAQRQQEPFHLAPPQPFREYIAWLEGRDMAAAEEFWRRDLAGFSAPTPLVVDRLPAAGETSRRALRQLVLAVDVTDGLRAFARRQGLTLSTLMHGATAVLLSRYSGETDVLFGTVTSGRSAPLPGIEEMVGIFINTLPMRVSIEADAPVSAWLQRVQTRQAEVGQFEHSPLLQVQGWSEVPRGGALFETILAFENYPVDAAMEERAGRELSLGALDASGQTNYPLAITASVAARWRLTALFDATRFDGATIDRMMRHLQSLLADLYGGERTVGSLTLLHAAEQQQLREWNATAADFPSESTLAEMFEAQVDRAPDLLAVEGAQGETLSYGGLEARANQLANLLRRLGACPGELVAIQLERSPAMVEALLGIAKSGAAYVPLETTFPEARLQWILGRMSVRAMVFGSATLDLIAGLAPELPQLRHLICLEPAAAPVLPAGVRFWSAAEIASCPASRPPALAGPEDLAYIIFTSGSTGAPKGVMIQHRPVANLNDWVNRTFSMGPGDRVLFITSLCFDLSVYDVFGVLAAGGAVRVASQRELEEPRALAGVLAAEPITFWDSAPAALQQIVPFLPPVVAEGSGENLRLVFLSGDWIPLPLPDQLRASFPGARVIALGGGTEATIWSNFFPVEEVAPEWRSVPYGRPIQNACYYVLDQRLDPCPIGVPGDLYIAGGCLATGYAAAPELTADRFLPDPFAGGPGAVMYRPGDRARFFPDGKMEFLGRLDHQVKIRGFRIELGEIEATLVSHPGVREAVALVREDAPGDKRLVAYVIAAGGAAPLPTPGELRVHLEARLPEYMVPSAFVFLDAWPVTPNGKLDRKALPAPDRALGGDVAAPRSPYEELLAGIFAEVLRVEPVGRQNSFFDLGGHSLLATQLASRLRDTFGVEVPLRTLFETPTVAELAVVIETELRGDGVVKVPPLERVPRSGPLPLSFGQQRLWFLDQLAPGSFAYNIPSSFLLRGPLTIPVLQRAFDEIVRRHEVLRTVFLSGDGEPLQWIGPARPQALPVVDLQALPAERHEAERARLTAWEARLPFDLARGPFLRITLLRLEEEAHAVLATMHHIASDGWSQGLLLGEVAALYEAFAAGSPSPLPELPIQYADFTVWQRRWLTGAVLEKELAYWRAQLRDLPPALELPTDHSRPAEQSFRGGLVQLRLPGQLSDSLRQLAGERKATLFMVLVAAFKVLLSRLTGQTDILVGTPIAGRNRAELEGLIGFFLNTLVLRADLRGDPAFSDLLAQVRASALGAYAHQAVPFERLLLDLKPERELGRTPVFQVLFNMMNRVEPEPSRTRLALQPLPVIETGAKLDLAVHVSEDPAGMALALVYDSSLFSQRRIEAVGEQLASLLTQVAAHPEAAIGSYSLVTAAALDWLPDPAQAIDEPPYELIPQLFLSLARRLPQRTAVRQGDRIWSYAELAAWAFALAGWLEARGCGRGKVVAISGPRCHELIGSILAVVLRGGVLLPLDRKLPEARQHAMLEQAGATCLVYVGPPRTEDGWMWKVPGLEVLPIPEAGCGALPPEDWEIAALHPDDPAYVFFTSGTSGVPKGILGCHKGLSHFLAWQRETFEIGTADRVAQLTGLSFDAVLRDVFLPLTSGAMLCLPAEDDLSGDSVLSFLADQSVTVLHTVPSLAALWLGRVPLAVRLPSLRWVFFAGEPLSDHLVRTWRAAFPETGGIVNLYGPTETTLVKCFYRVPDPPPSGIQPAGFAMPETQALVLAGEPVRMCGIGEPGEIVLRTPFRTRGYLAGAPDAAQRFRANPFRDDPDDLLYHTGDRGRYRPDGNLEILGRLDDQVKIRGVRVEPAEIAAVLAREPEVRECAVVAHEQAGGERSLVAYVVPQDGASLPWSELRRRLSAQLPEYMIPASFVSLDALPLTPNGKLDRKALPAPGAPLPQDRGQYVAPRDPVERDLALLWGELLQLPAIGVHDDFFELGGHSLLVLRLKAEIQARFGRSLALADLFRGPTVEAMAAALRNVDAGKPVSPLIPLRRVGSLATLFCIHPAGGLVLGYQPLVDRIGPEISVYGLQARGFEADEEPCSGLAEMARLYVSAIRSLQPGPYRLAGWSFGGLVAFEMAQQLTAAGEEVALLALLDSAPPGSLDADGLSLVDRSDLLVHIARDIGIEITAEELRRMGWDQQLEHLAALAVRLRLVPDAASAASYLGRRMAVQQGNIMAAATYAARPYSGAVTFFRASEVPGPTPDDLIDRWRPYVSGSITVHRVPGNHRSMMQEPHVEILARLLKHLLAQGVSPYMANTESFSGIDPALQSSKEEADERPSA